jgi:HAD superfamily hydrolase (TIGR01484 family)
MPSRSRRPVTRTRGTLALDTTPQLVATDLDGTIVRSDGSISPRTIEAFARVERAGARYVFVTGRPPRLMADIIEAFGPQGTAICSNGAFVIDLSTSTVVRERPIPVDVLARAAAALRHTIPEIGLAVEYADELAGDARYEAGEWDADVTVRRLADAELFGRPGHKLIGRHPRLSADELLAHARPAVGDLVNVYHSNGLRLVEAVAAGVSKSAALAELTAVLGINPAQVMAFGDMPNDLPMLAWAGIPYAVANAHPDVLAAVAHVAGGSDEDGVAAVLEQVFG